MDMKTLFGPNADKVEEVYRIYQNAQSLLNMASDHINGVLGPQYPSKVKLTTQIDLRDVIENIGGKDFLFDGSWSSGHKFTIYHYTYSGNYDIFTFGVNFHGFLSELLTIYSIITYRYCSKPIREIDIRQNSISITCEHNQSTYKDYMNKLISNGAIMDGYK